MSRYEPDGRIGGLESSPVIRFRARELRRESTPAEERLWEALRDRKWQGLKFRRQKPLGQFIVDFYCAERRLIVEVDGSIHGQPEVQQHDEARDVWLQARGNRIVRLSVQLVMADIKQALERIATALCHSSMS